RIGRRPGSTLLGDGPGFALFVPFVSFVVFVLKSRPATPPRALASLAAWRFTPRTAQAVHPKTTQIPSRTDHAAAAQHPLVRLRRLDLRVAVDPGGLRLLPDGGGHPLGAGRLPPGGLQLLAVRPHADRPRRRAVELRLE